MGENSRVTSCIKVLEDGFDSIPAHTKAMVRNILEERFLEGSLTKTELSAIARELLDSLKAMPADSQGDNEN